LGRRITENCGSTLGFSRPRAKVKTSRRLQQFSAGHRAASPARIAAPKQRRDSVCHDQTCNAIISAGGRLPDGMRSISFLDAFRITPNARSPPRTIQTLIPAVRRPDIAE